jgi:hypothetical protein
MLKYNNKNVHVCPYAEQVRTHVRRGTQIRTPQKENKAERRKSFVLKQTHFIANDDAIARKYIELISSAVRRFSKSEQLPEDGQVRPKRVAIDVILMLF